MSSNLYKQRYFMNEQPNSRIINSNRVIELKMKEQARANRINNTVQNMDGFVEGISKESFAEEVKFDKEKLFAEARAQAKQIVEDAQKQAEQILESAEQQKQQIFEDQKQLGYEAGVAQMNQILEEERAKLAESQKDYKEQMDTCYNEKFSTMERDLIDVIVEVFESVFHIQFADKKEILFALVQNTILNVDAGKNFNIHVSGEDFAFIEERMNDVQTMLGNSVSLEVTRDARIEQGACQIETNFGMFDCGIDTQLEALIRDIRSLAR